MHILHTTLVLVDVQHQAAQHHTRFVYIILWSLQSEVRCTSEALHDSVVRVLFSNYTLQLPRFSRTSPRSKGIQPVTPGRHFSFIIERRIRNSAVLRLSSKLLSNVSKMLRIGQGLTTVNESVDTLRDEKVHSAIDTRRAKRLEVCVILWGIVSLGVKWGRFDVYSSNQIQYPLNPARAKIQIP